MVNKLTNGDYVVRGSTIVRVTGLAARFQDALFRLQCRRGSFPFLPELGSQLWRLGMEKASNWDAHARQYCAEALRGTGITAQKIQVTRQGRALLVELSLTEGTARMDAEVTV